MRFVFLLVIFTPAIAQADLIVSNWIATPTTLSFDITGTIGPGATIGPDQPASLFIGPANLGNQAGADTVEGTAVSLGGTPTLLSRITLFSDSGSDKLQLRKLSAWVNGDFLNYHISFANPNLVDLSGFDPTGAIVSAGRSNYFAAPEGAYQVGTFVTTATIPEPSSMTLFGLGTLGIGLIARRRKQQQLAA